MRKSVENTILKTAAAKHWQRIGIGDHHGIAVFLPGLRTCHSCGIGEYLDLLPLIDWCADVGFDVIQLLPLNDNGMDISPYNALSAFALNPLLLSLHALSPAAADPSIKKLRSFNSSKLTPYEKVHSLKESLLLKYCSAHKQSLLLNKEYLQFTEDNSSWLQPYSLFKAGGKKTKALLYTLIQFLCHRQMNIVKKYAEDKDVLIKGDIPILVAPKSVDVATHPEIFDLTLSAGAPPDQYSLDGQNWGFPIYRWESHYDEIMRWWLQRLNHAANYYHLYRLDHVVGLFRIWAIPPGKSARDGSFIPSTKREWLPKGKRILKAFLKGCPMLPIAEDLGCVPQSVRDCLETLGIPGTKVLRWEGETMPEKYPPISMTTLSTHDVETTAEWWSKYPEEASSFANQAGWRYRKPLSHQREFEIITLSHHSRSLFHINLLQEILRLDPQLCWKNPADDRINVPATHSKHNWRYRYKESVERITASAKLKKAIRKALNSR